MRSLPLCAGTAIIFALLVNNLSCGQEPAPPAAGGGSGPAAGLMPAARFELALYREQSQGAFRMLIPKGWKAEGGMIPSGVEWNVVDLVEHNIRFRVTSPDGKSFFGWYPRFYFQDPAVIAQSSMGMLQMQPGQVINGCWLFPYMSVEQYVRTIVFPYFAPDEFKNPKVAGGARPAPELKPWIPKVASRAEAGYVNFEAAVRGVPSCGRIYAIVYEIGGVIWTTVGSFGLVAPRERWAEDERLMETCIRTFSLDPQWVARAAAAERSRAQQYHDTIREIHRIDAEIQQNRSQTASDINHEFYKVLTGQMEAFDPETGETKWLPMYSHAWTDGKGNYIVSDSDSGALPEGSAADWKPLEIVARGDPAQKE